MRTYNAAVTVWQGAKPGIDAQVLKRKTVAQSERPIQGFGCRPAAPQHNPGGAPLDAHHFFLDPPDDRSGIGAHCYVSGAGCKPCAIPHDSDDLSPFIYNCPLSEGIINKLHY